MSNYVFELFRLKSTLLAKGMESEEVEAILEEASTQIDMAMAEKMSSAEEQLIDAGVEKRSADFINQLRPQPGAFAIETESGNTSFSTPPFPMLNNLLKNAKPIKDGSGVYKVIPVGGDGPKPSLANNIFDVQKAQLVAQKEQLKQRASRGAQKPSFRTATSKQNASEKWVYPAETKDFTNELKDVNESLKQSLEDIVESIIRRYEDAP